VGAELAVQWTRDLGEGRLLVMECVAEDFRASLAGFRGVGSTQKAALDDLLKRVQEYGTSSHDFARSMAPGGRLHARLRAIKHRIDPLVREKA
jgi:hypothetical protein